MKFLDQAKVYIRSGTGGAGSVSFRREKFLEFGGPDGGDGGRGGHVIMRGNANQWTLFHLKFKKHIRAEHGGHGSASRSTGADGADVYVDVPLGTVVRDAETNEILFEITEHNQTPRYSQPGIPLQERDILLELKILADVGLVGFPNAGKSTLLSVITSAKPKIADYEFTTLKPNLGIVEYRDFQTFVMADIPGIIEGAAEGKGLGHYFLRHIERNSILLFLIPADAKDILNQYEILLDELRRYNPEMLDKERLIAISKCDFLDAELESELKKELDEILPIEYIMISAVAQKGISELKDKLWKMLNA